LRLNDKEAYRKVLFPIANGVAFVFFFFRTWFLSKVWVESLGRTEEVKRILFLLFSFRKKEFVKTESGGDIDADI
jgi:hypothetical protein